MSEAVMRVLLAAVGRAFRRRAAVLRGVVSSDPSRVDEGLVVDRLTELTAWARGLSWAVTVLFLRGEARAAGAGESWVPAPPPYGRRAVRAVVRGVPGGLARGWDAVVAALEDHVEAAHRQTVVSAVVRAPEAVGVLLGGLDGLVGDLEGFPRESVEALRRDLRRGLVESAGEREARRRRELDEAFDRVAERVGEAVRRLEGEGLLPRAGVSHTGPVAPVPVSDRTDASGRLIVRPFAWARVCHPSASGPCGLCALAAARGPVYRSRVTAMGDAGAFHAACRCSVVPVFTSRSWAGKEESLVYAGLYQRVVRDHDLHGAEARTAVDNALRGTRSGEKSEARRRRAGRG